MERAQPLDTEAWEKPQGWGKSGRTPILSIGVCGVSKPCIQDTTEKPESCMLAEEQRYISPLVPLPTSTLWARKTLPGLTGANELTASYLRLSGYTAQKLTDSWGRSGPQRWWTSLGVVGPCESLSSGVLMGLRRDPSTLTSFLSTPKG